MLRLSAFVGSWPDYFLQLFAVARPPPPPLLDPPAEQQRHGESLVTELFPVQSTTRGAGRVARLGVKNCKRRVAIFAGVSATGWTFARPDFFRGVGH